MQHFDPSGTANVAPLRGNNDSLPQPRGNAEAMRS